jgi:phospholipid transport system substrate-binding protein
MWVVKAAGKNKPAVRIRGRRKAIAERQGQGGAQRQLKETQREADMNQRYCSLILIFAILMLMPLYGYAATAKETVETGVNEVIGTLSDPAFKAKAKDEQVAQIGGIIDTIFDFEELSKRTLGRSWKKMSAEQQKEFVPLFRQLLQGVYADRLLAYSDQKVIFDKETMLKKGRAEVQSYLQTSDGKKIPLFYRLTDKSGSWKVYDVIIEGVSMVKNYRTQFRQILTKDSPEKLLEILRDKVNQG